MNPNAPVAQLDRALPSEGKGHTFESCRVRHVPEVELWADVSRLGGIATVMLALPTLIVLITSFASAAFIAFMASFDNVAISFFLADA
jgi:hypothetical protein